MIVVIQRVNKAFVKVNEKLISEIKKGILVFLGIEKEDNTKDADYLINKVINLRVFEDSQGKMNFSIKDIGGEILVISEFTLAADCKKGNRPSFDKAMPPEDAEKLYRYFIETLTKTGIPVKEGSFRSFMHVSIVNEGPVTFILNTK